VHLGYLIGQHVSVIIVHGEPESPLVPADYLHGGVVRDHVRKVAPRLFEQACVAELGLPLRVEGFLENVPKFFLPFEHRLFGDDLGGGLVFKAACEEDVCHLVDVVQGVVIDHSHVFVVFQVASIYDGGLDAVVIREEGADQLAGPDRLPACALLAPHCMAVTDDRVLKAQLHAVDHYGVARDCDSIPAPTHGSVGRAERVLQSPLLLLNFGGRDGGLLEY